MEEKMNKIHRLITDSNSKQILDKINEIVDRLNEDV